MNGRQVAADVPELAPLWRAVERGTKRARLRVLVVVCPQGHTLLEVFPGGGRLWAVAQDHEGVTYAAAVPEAGDLPRLVGGGVSVSTGPGPSSFPLSRCRCQDHMGMPARQLRAALEDGKARQVIARWADTTARRAN